MVRNSYFLVDLPKAREVKVTNLEILVDGAPQDVLRLSPVRSSPLESPEQGFRIAIYFDVPLIASKGLESAVRALSAHSDDLAALGQVEIILADPHSLRLLAPSREPDRIRDALRQVGEEAVSVGELIWMRQRFATLIDDSRPGSSVLGSSEPRNSGPVPAAARDALRRESAFLDERRAALLRWASACPGTMPGLLLLVQDGFDLDIEGYYLARNAESRSVSSATREQRQLAASLAAEGWTVAPLALGRRPAEFSNPYAPLLELAEASGGTLVTRPRGLGKLLDRISESWIVSAAISGPPGGTPRPMEVQFRGTAEGVVAPRWAAAETCRLMRSFATGMPTPSANGSAIRILRPGQPMLTGRVRFQTVTGRRRIDRVQFSLDGSPVGRDESAPFQIEVELGAEPYPRRLQVEAFSRSGRKVGEDAITFNSPPRSFDIALKQVQGSLGDDEVEFEAQVSLPSSGVLAGVDFYCGDKLLETLPRPPFRTRLALSELDSGAFVRGVARLVDGSSVEDAMMVFSPESRDRLEVNLVEVLAVVTNGSQFPPRLAKEDFSISQGGEHQTIRQFADSAQLPLELGLAIDTSQSMASWMPHMRQAAAHFLEKTLRPEDKAFLVHFDTGPRLAQSPTSDLDLLERRLGGLRPRGDTVLYDSLIFSLLHFEGQAERRALVVLTDGIDEGSAFGPKDCVREAATRGVPIYFMILGLPPDPVREPRRSGLVRLAKQTGGRVFYLSSFDDLDRIYQRIRIELENQYLLAYSTPHALSNEELLSVEVRVRDKRLSVRAVPATRAPGG